MEAHAHVVRVTTFQPVEGRLDEFIERARRLAHRAGGSEGCFGAQVCSVDDARDQVAMVSRWESRDRLEAFVAAMADEQAALTGSDLLAAAPQIRHYTSLRP